MAQSFQAPKGTRDFYPQDLLRRRYIEKLWRDTSIRHGFEEIDGPTFEHTELYTAKSGEGIVSEIFGAFSGKDEQEVRLMGAAIGAGKAAVAPYALRPEFTPTLARMYAARAGSLPRPTKWFWMQNCYRAERPQRGRLREFGQWNCDVIGDASPGADADVISCCVGLVSAVGLMPADVRVRFNHRHVLASLLARLGVDDEHMGAAFVLLDRREKLDDDELEAMAFEFGLTEGEFIAFLRRPRGPIDVNDLLGWAGPASSDHSVSMSALLRAVQDELAGVGISGWCDLDFNIVRGLAYYTGMVFEVIAAGERAVAGGGRYDNLIETFGGLPTAAVGFGMGDVVLANLLADKGLFPPDDALPEILSRAPAGYRPDAFVVSNGSPEADAQVRPLVARLRRGQESDAWLARDTRKPWDADRYSVPPLHARHSHKQTKNVGKLLKEAADARARHAVIIESGDEATIKDMRTQEQLRVRLAEVGTRICAVLVGTRSASDGSAG